MNERTGGRMDEKMVLLRQVQKRSAIKSHIKRFERNVIQENSRETSKRTQIVTIEANRIKK